jgi:hypothetical protein
MSYQAFGRAMEGFEFRHRMRSSDGDCAPGVANIRFATGSIVHDVYNVVGCGYFRLIDRISVVIGRRGLSSAALKRIFEVVGVFGGRRRRYHNERCYC